MSHELPGPRSLEDAKAWMLDKLAARVHPMGLTDVSTSREVIATMPLRLRQPKIVARQHLPGTPGIKLTPSILSAVSRARTILKSSAPMTRRWRPTGPSVS
jgi:hypothetical protein